MTGPCTKPAAPTGGGGGPLGLWLAGGNKAPRPNVASPVVTSPSRRHPLWSVAGRVIVNGPCASISLFRLRHKYPNARDAPIGRAGANTFTRLVLNPRSRLCRFTVERDAVVVAVAAIGIVARSLDAHCGQALKAFHREASHILSGREAQHSAAGELMATIVARRFCLHDSTAGRLVCIRASVCHTIRSALSFWCDLCPALCNALSNLVIAITPRRRGGSDQITFRSPSKYRDFPMFLICLESISVMMKFSYGFPDFCEQLFSCSEFVFDFEFATAFILFRCLVGSQVFIPREDYCFEAMRRLDAFMACSYTHARMNPCAPGLCSSLYFWLYCAVA